MTKLLLDKCYTDSKSPQSAHGWFVRHIKSNSVVAAFADEAAAQARSADANERYGSGAYDIIKREGNV